MIKRYIIPIFVPHLGCPHDCVFCNQRRITNASHEIKREKVVDTIERYLSYFNRKALIEIAFYGGSFTAIDLSIQNQLLSLASTYKKKGLIDEIRISTRPDAITPDILDNLIKYQVNTIELGVQSLDKEVLRASARGHSCEEVYEAVELIRSYGFKLGLQMMIGLPTDNREKVWKTALQFVDMRPDYVRIYPTLVIRDTYLERLTDLNKYKPLSIKEAVDITTPLLALFYINEINVIRVGLQATENIQLGKDVVAGPFHPAFRQLVESNLYREIIDFYLGKKKVNTLGESFEIFANEKEISNIVGQGSTNISYFNGKYGFLRTKIYKGDVGPNNLDFKIGSYRETFNRLTLMEKYLETKLKYKD